MGNSMFNTNSSRNNGGGAGSNVTVIDNLNSTSGTDALSAKQGGILAQQIQDANGLITAHEGVTASTTELGHIKVDGVTATVGADGTLKVLVGGLSPDNIVDTLISTDINKALSANQGRVLKEEIDNHAKLIASDTVLGHVRVDGTSVTISPEGVISSSGGSINLPISANDVSETTTKQFIEGTLKSQITSNTSTLNNQELRLSNVESTIANISTSDEKVKLNALGTSGYLEDFIDNSTLVISNNKLAVNSLQGLTATVSEINSLQGVNGNIQAQINSLNAIGNFSTTVMTYSELESILNPKPQDMVIVLSDETHSGNSTIYIYNGSSWIYSGDFKGGEVRDFKTNPIDLSTETNGVLQKSKYEKQNASETSISDTNNNFTATNVEDALVELFQYVNSGKSGVATSIGYPLSSSDNFSIMVDKINILKNSFSNNLTKKGVITYNYEPLSQMIDKIPSIPNVTISTGVNTVSKLNVTTPYQYKLVLKEPIPLEKIATSVLSYVGNDSGIVHYEVNYNNSDASNFDYDKDKVVFDGVMKLRDTWTYILNSLGNNYYESEFINISNFSDIGSINILTENLEISALEDNAQIVKANGDISLNSVDSIDKLTLIGNSVNNGVVKITMSFDGGITWNYFDNLTSSWKTLDINNTIDFKNNGMTIDTLNNLNSQQLKDIRNNSEILRFAYYLERNSFLDNAFVDKLTVLVTMLGYNTLANFTDYNYSYDLETKTISYNFLKNGTYTINYVDGN